MEEFKVNLKWQAESNGFSYKKYTRTHTWKFGGGMEIKASAAPAYLGNPEFVNPEEAFIASLSSCHLLTFLAIASFKKFEIKSYEDNASGLVEKNANNKLAVTKVYLRSKVEFSGEKQPDEAELEKMHHKAHAEYFISNSVVTEVEIEHRIIGNNKNPEKPGPAAGGVSQNMKSIEDMKDD
jgi:organic hydroperoxide reductase OsmC/OhrA